MNKRNNDLIKINEILENDRCADLGDNKFINLFSMDLEKVIKEYFSYDNHPIIKVEKLNSNTNLYITIENVSCKHFKSFN